MRTMQHSRGSVGIRDCATSNAMIMRSVLPFGQLRPPSSSQLAPQLNPASIFQQQERSVPTNASSTGLCATRSCNSAALSTRRRRSGVARADVAATAPTAPGYSNGKNGVSQAAPPTIAEQQAPTEDDLVGVDDGTAGLSVVVVGASGDLAKKKIFPALFALYYEGLLPTDFRVFGYARSKMSDDEFRKLIESTLTCRIDAKERCAEAQEIFLKRCFYTAGPYDKPDGYKDLNKRMTELEEKSNKEQANRMFFLSIPPNVFVSVAGGAADHCSSTTGWTRVVVEKPFGRDSESSAELAKDLAKHLKEEQIFRIDHYLGKELIENLTVLRFANLVFEPLWSRQYIRNVQVIFSENFGTEGRGGYFDQYGIIRDVIQNHLLQIVALFAMEQPVSLDAEDIRNEKVKVVRSMRPVVVDDVVLGQYRSRSEKNGNNLPGYLDDPTVPKGSLTPTFAAIAMHINNARWDGVPILLKAGKALHRKGAEIRVQFRHVPGNIYKDRFGANLDSATNELVIRIQPKEAIYLKINNKVPGLGLRLDTTRLDLQYQQAYDKKELPDSYERLLLDVVNGDKRLFIRNDELEAAWALFTPMLQELEAKKIAPELYPYGSRGPVGSHYLAAKYGVRWGDMMDDEA